jgi:adenylosuccinate lyase
LRELFSERERRRLWRAVWVALARSQERAGLLARAEVEDLEAHAGEIDIEAALEIEREIGHDLMAEIRVFASQAKHGGGKLHLGATSMDIEDNVETYRFKQALSLVGARLHELLALFAARIERYDDHVCLGYTHLQPAEPTTIGYRLAVYAQDLLIDEAHLREAYEQLSAKGIRGAVGTSASFERLLRGSGRSARQQEEEILTQFDLQAREASGQTYPRKLDYLVVSTLAGVGASLSKFANDLRILSSPGFGEMFEPFGAKQVGSSAMPFKRNPVIAERICSLARLLPAYAGVLWQNAATNGLERTLDDSANRRAALPEAFLCSDELLGGALRIVEGLRIDERRIAQNLRAYGPFAGCEAILLEAVKAGGDRQVLHEAIRVASLKAYEAIERGGDNPLPKLLVDDLRLTTLLDPAEIRALLDPTDHVGDAPERARRVAAQISELPPFPRPRTLSEAAS